MKNGDMRSRLEALREAGCFRSLRTAVFLPGRRVIIDGKESADFSSNDYLGLRNHPAVIEAAQRALALYGAGGGASRLVSGNIRLYDELEGETARFKRTPSALVFGSGYLLNLSVIPALVSAGDAVLCDRLSHASLVDGIKLSGARLLVYPHCDMDGLEGALKQARKYRQRLIVTDTIFSMDGDGAPLAAIAALAAKYGARVLVDEAHATGVLGAQGRGLADAEGLEGRLDFVMGTYSKALGSLGAFLACSHGEKDYFVNTARGLIFTTALPPAVLAASIEALRLCAAMDAERQRLAAFGERARRFLAEKGFDAGGSVSQIIPVILGDEKKAVDASARLMEKGFFVPAIRYPAVRKKGARLRISLSSAHGEDQIEGLLEAIGAL